MDHVSIAIAGFAVVSALLLFVAYAVFIKVPGKSVYSISSCAALVAALMAIQIGHLLYFQDRTEPLTTFYYRIGLFAAPSSFYFFARWAILPTEQMRTNSLLHLLPISLIFVPYLEVSLPILFTIGVAYSLWLGHLVWGLRDRRKQFLFEFGYFGVMSVLAVLVLALGFAIPYVDDAWFYYFYNVAIGLGIAIMLVALVVNPNLLGELAEAARARYGTSTLGDVDVESCIQKLERHMIEGKAYLNPDLSLSSLAADVGISSHQLSELINTKLGMGFSRYVRERRVEAAKALLVAAPSQSILSVSLDTGFRSQSAFYAAFKEMTGQSPGDYRSANIVRSDLSGSR